MDRRKDEFLATLAHELRNPLTPISNASYLLKKLSLDDKLSKDRSLPLLNMLERQANNLVRLVDDLLDVARISVGKIQLKLQRIDLAAIVANAVEMSNPLIEARHHKLTVDLPAEPLPLDVDARTTRSGNCQSPQ